MNTLQELHNFCLRNKLSIATAESCTAGLLASMITSIPGSSSFFNGGVIAYQNNIKIDVLGVSALTIRKKTEVSSEVVEQMATGVRDRFFSDFSIATSGYAGPSGGSKLNPVGTIFIAVSTKKKVVSKRVLFKGDRHSIVRQSVITAVDFLMQELKKQY